MPGWTFRRKPPSPDVESRRSGVAAVPPTDNIGRCKYPFDSEPIRAALDVPRVLTACMHATHVQVGRVGDRVYGMAG